MNHLENHVMCLLKSFKHWTGNDLLSSNETIHTLTEMLWKAPFVIVSHGVEPDPLLNYGNQKALELWEMSWEQFIHTPSRLTAEALNQEERARLLLEVTMKGYIENYSGVRISATGKRFMIENAIVWNLLDENMKHCGQAATFTQWRYL